MTEVNVWFGLTTFLFGSVLTGIATYFAFMRESRDFLTKEAHANVCADKQQIISVQLVAINDKLTDHGKKLDRILLNGQKGGNK